MADKIDIEQEIWKILDGDKETLDEIFQPAQKPATVVPPMQGNAYVNITVSEDKMEASICVFSPVPGGKDVTPEQIQEEINSRNIVYGIDWNMLEGIVNSKLYDTYFVFAQGDPKEDGKNGKVTARYDQIRKLKPKLLEDGTVDFRDLGAVVNIRKGDPICDIEEATKGTDGMDIFGRELKARPGKPARIPIGTNTIVNGDGTMLIAQRDGNLKYDRGRFVVETEYVVYGDVDVSTGNIRFIGDVVVKGNVESGFSVESDKSILVNGMADGAVLIAGGNVTVKNGVVNSKITAKEGSVKIGFGENTEINCRKGLSTASMVGCEVKCEGDMECISNPGVIAGGSYSILGSLKCSTLGHRSYTLTTLEIGNISAINEEKEVLEKRLAEINSNISKLEDVSNLLKELRSKGVKLDKDKEQAAATAVRLKVQKAQEKKPLLARVAVLENYLSSANYFNIAVGRSMFPNVKITIGNASSVTKKEYGKCTIRNSGGEISII